MECGTTLRNRKAALACSEPGNNACHIFQTLQQREAQVPTERHSLFDDGDSAWIPSHTIPKLKGGDSRQLAGCPSFRQIRPLTVVFGQSRVCIATCVVNRDRSPWTELAAQLPKNRCFGESFWARRPVASANSGKPNGRSGLFVSAGLRDTDNLLDFGTASPRVRAWWCQ